MVDAQNFEAGTTLAFKSLNNVWEEAKLATGSSCVEFGVEMNHEHSTSLYFKCCL
jgi:hypothetical protein